MSEASICYVGRCGCGAIRAATVAEPGHEKRTAKDVAEFIRSGLTVEPMETEAVRVASWTCTCPRRPRDPLQGILL